jgi:ech hydrogenase subunit F
MRGFPGISRVIIKSLIGRPSTLMHPQRKRVFPDATRGKVENDIKRCIFCRLCEKNCPTKALAVSKESRDWQIDSLKCCTCRRCVEVCPAQCLSMYNVYFPPVGSRGDGIYVTVLPPGEPIAKLSRKPEGS